jgi:acyl transferase domain-containing protein/phosphopantetheinyl transferase
MSIGNDSRHQVAIVGMAALMPGASTLDAYWHNLVNGVDAITDAPPHRVNPKFYDPALAQRPDRLYCRRGGFVDEFPPFDPLKFGLMPVSVPDIEPEQLIALEVAAAAVEDAGGTRRLPAGDRVGVIIGRAGNLGNAQGWYLQRVRLPTQIIEILRELIPDLNPHQLDQVREKFDEWFGPHRPEGTIGLVPNLTASRIANRLDLRGPAYVLDAACASSLIAVDHAIAELASGRLDAVLAGGVHHTHDVTFWSVFSQLGALSRRGEIRPFDSAADGLLMGEGTGIVVLKRLTDALHDGDRIYAVIRGSGTSSDGMTASMFNPATSGQVLAVRRAWEAAGLDPTAPDALGMLEAHGTATPAGDAAELATVAEVFGPSQGGPRPVIGSVKSMIGHAMPAAGIAGLIKAALAVYRGVLLPTLHCDTPRPELERTRFAPIATTRPWASDGPRRAAVNAFGFGGINAHIVIEQAPEAPVTRNSTGSPAAPTVTVAEQDQMLWLSAPDPAALARLLDDDDHAVRALGADRARGTSPAAADERCRLGIIDPSGKRLATARKAVANGRALRGGRDIWFSPDPLLADGAPGRLAFVFPGPEAEFAPRTKDISSHFGLPDREWSSTDVGWHGANLIAVGKLLNDALRRIGITPDAVVGYSLGEWTAGITAGQVSGPSSDAFLRSFKAESVEVKGHGFATVGASAARITPMLSAYPGVRVTHDNGPAQCVVHGPDALMDPLVEALRKEYILCHQLPFRFAFHTPLAAAGLESIRAALPWSEVHTPSVPVWSATIAAPFPTDPEQVRELFVRNLLEPVRFRQTIAAMYDAGVRVFLQVGVGQLASLINDNLSGRDHLAMPVNVAGRSGLNQLRRVATALWVEGATPDPRALDSHPQGRTVNQSVRRGPTVKLDLGGPLIRLGDGARGLLGVYGQSAQPTENGDTQSHTTGSTPRSHTDTDHADSPERSSALSALHRLAGQSSAAAELATLLEETAQDAVTVIESALGTTAGLSAESADIPAPTVDETAGLPSPGQPSVQRTVLRVSLEEMPYLKDHCFFHQPADWPNPEDRLPVVPGTTIAQHMIDAAQRVVPEMRVIGVRDLRLNRRLVAVPPKDIKITVKRAESGELSVTVGEHARAKIAVVAEYPAESPEVWPHDPATERPARISAEDIYAERLLFHGPQFQGITKVHALGDMHIRGTLTTMPPPGALWDGALQLAGHWLVSTLPTRTLALPTRIGRAMFFRPQPAVGTELECVAWIRSVEDSQIVIDAQLIDNDGVWAELEGCVLRRLETHPQVRPAELFPQRHPISLRQPEGWTVAFDYWTHPMSRDRFAQSFLGVNGNADYERQTPSARKQWLLGRIAVKDAVRFRLWDDGHSTVFPIELTVGNDPNGRPRVCPRPGRNFPDCDVSLAHTAEIGVAIAKLRTPFVSPDEPGVGIDVTEITDHPESTIEFALSDAEVVLLDSMVTATGEERRVWFTRFWAAKEAASKAEGTGLKGSPKRFAVLAASPAMITVATAGRSYQVKHREVSNPEELPTRRYVVGWTWGPEQAR